MARGDPTTAWERKRRRRDVIRLKAQNYSVPEIAEELGWHEDTIRRDLKRINDELAKWDEPEVLSKELRRLLFRVLEEEYEDLRQAEVEQDEQAKHRAKQSARSTAKTIKEVEEDLGLTESKDSVEWFEDLDEETQEKLTEAAGEEVEEFLGEGMASN